MNKNTNMELETNTTQDSQRDAEIVVQRPNLNALSDDAILNGDSYEVNKVEQIKPEETNEEIPEETKDDTLTIEKPVEEAEKPLEEQDEITELSLNDSESELSLESSVTDEPQEGSWLYVAKEAGLEGVTDDSFESVREAIIRPYLERENAKIEDYLLDIDPKIRLEVELSKSGMSYEDIKAPLENIAKFKAMDDVSLYREDLMLRHPKATQEWIDADIEKALTIDGAVEHEATRIRMILDDNEGAILQQREQQIQEFSINKERILNDRRVQEKESMIKALNDRSELMGLQINEEAKKIMSDRASSGKYDQLLSDPDKKAEFIAFLELKDKVKEAQKIAVAKSYAKGKLEITKELYNIPPIQTGGAARQQTKTTGGLSDLEHDSILNGEK